MLYFSKEATNKDNQLKTQMLVSFQGDESKGSEKVWLESGFLVINELSCSTRPSEACSKC